MHCEIWGSGGTSSYLTNMRDNFAPKVIAIARTSCNCNLQLSFSFKFLYRPLPPPCLACGKFFSHWVLMLPKPSTHCTGSPPSFFFLSSPSNLSAHSFSGILSSCVVFNNPFFWYMPVAGMQGEYVRNYIAHAPSIRDAYLRMFVFLNFLPHIVKYSLLQLIYGVRPEKSYIFKLCQPAHPHRCVRHCLYLTKTFFRLHARKKTPQARHKAP